MKRFDLDSAGLRLSAELIQDGLQVWAAKVMEATALGTTPTAICLTLRSDLHQFLQGVKFGRQRTFQLVHDLLHHIEPAMI